MRGIIAYFDSSHDCPEEIIMAAGFTPYKILGKVECNSIHSKAENFLSPLLCPAAKSMLSEALEPASCNQWEGIIVAHGCDATNRQFDIWRRYVKTSFIYWINSPMNLNSTARKFFHKEITRLIEYLENHFNINITDSDLSDSLEKSNHLKLLLREMGMLRSSYDIPNRQYFEWCRRAIQESKDKVIDDLSSYLQDLKSRTPDFPSHKKKILLTGSDVTYPEWMDLLESANLRVVRDDLSIGERYYATNFQKISLRPTGSVKKNREVIIDSIIDYYFSIPRPATKNPPDPRLKYLLDITQNERIDGIISQNLKFCEPYAFDAVYLKSELKQHGFSVLHLEREYTATFDQQLLTRLEAFAEII